MQIQLAKDMGILSGVRHFRQGCRKYYVKHNGQIICYISKKFRHLYNIYIAAIGCLLSIYTCKLLPFSGPIEYVLRLSVYCTHKFDLYTYLFGVIV